MSVNNVSERIKKVIVDHLGVEEDQVTDNASFTDDLGADSLDAVALLAAVNESFGTHISNDMLPEIETVQQMVDAVEKALKK